MCMDENEGSFMVPSYSGFLFTELPRSIIELLNSTEVFWCSFWDNNVLNVIWKKIVNLGEVYTTVLNKVLS